MDYRELRANVVEVAQRMSASGLVTGTSGNVSARTGDGSFLVTPSGVSYSEITLENIALVDQDGRKLSGPLLASVETPMHLGIYSVRPEVQGIVHTHARHSTILACLGLEIPPVHYMLAELSSEGRVPVAEYAIYGSEDLARNVGRALGDSHKASLLHNHGAITVGDSASEALSRTEILEEMAEIYYKARLAGGPKLLSEEQITETVNKMSAGYGRMHAAET